MLECCRGSSRASAAPAAARDNRPLDDARTPGSCARCRVRRTCRGALEAEELRVRDDVRLSGREVRVLGQGHDDHEVRRRSTATRHAPPLQMGAPRCENCWYAEATEHVLTGTRPPEVGRPWRSARTGCTAAARAARASAAHAGAPLHGSPVPDSGTTGRASLPASSGRNAPVLHRAGVVEGAASERATRDVEPGRDVPADAVPGVRRGIVELVRDEDLDDVALGGIEDDGAGLQE